MQNASFFCPQHLTQVSTAHWLPGCRRNADAVVSRGVIASGVRANLLIDLRTHLPLVARNKRPFSTVLDHWVVLKNVTRTLRSANAHVTPGGTDLFMHGGAGREAEDWDPGLARVPLGLALLVELLGKVRRLAAQRQAVGDITDHRCTAFLVMHYALPF